MKRLIALLLALVMVFGLTACGKPNTPTGTTEGNSTTNAPTTKPTEAEPGKDLSWLHPNSEPLVDEGVEKTLSLVIVCGDNVNPPETRYAYKYIEEVLNVNLEVEYVVASAAKESIPLLFASNELPDIVIVNQGGELTPSQLLEYGEQEGQIIDLVPYMTPELMPNLSHIYAERPDYKAPVTLPSGAIYSLGEIGNSMNWAQIGRTWINQTWLDANNLKSPTTLDEFTEVMRAAKASGDYEYPIGGTFINGATPVTTILNAFGYVFTVASDGHPTTTISMRNGTPVLPGADREAYGEFIKYLKMLYDEGLIHPEFFTMDAATNTAMVKEGKFLVVRNTLNSSFSADALYDWWGVAPLTSALNPEPIVGVHGSATNAGVAVVTSACEEIELACAFLDYWFEPNDDFLSLHAILQDYGPSAGKPFAEDYPEAEMLKVEGGIAMRDSYGKYDSNWLYCLGQMCLWNPETLGAVLATDLNDTPIATDYAKLWKENGAGPENRTKYESGQIPGASTYDVAKDYVTTDVFPKVVYLDAESQEIVDNLALPLTEHIEAETAKFVTGARPIEELDAYFDELDKLGAQEYVQIYVDYYNSLNG